MVAVEPGGRGGGEREISSPRSARVVEVRKLHDRRHRARLGRFLVEGPHAVADAIAAGAVDEVFVTAEWSDDDLVGSARAAGAPVRIASDPALAAMAETRHPQGILAVCRVRTTGLDAALRPGTSRAVLLDRIRDPGNAGTVIRTADAAGVDAVVLTRGSVDPHNGKCVRASAGSIFHIAITAEVDTASAIDAARRAGMRILVADGRGSTSLPEARDGGLLEGPLLWAFGPEAEGLDPRLRDAADAVVAIPMHGGAESLNLAVAAGICLYA